MSEITPDENKAYYLIPPDQLLDVFDEQPDLELKPGEEIKPLIQEKDTSPHQIQRVRVDTNRQALERFHSMLGFVLASCRNDFTRGEAVPDKSDSEFKDWPYFFHCHEHMTKTRRYAAEAARIPMTIEQVFPITPQAVIGTNTRTLDLLHNNQIRVVIGTMYERLQDTLAPGKLVALRNGTDVLGGIVRTMETYPANRVEADILTDFDIEAIDPNGLEQWIERRQRRTRSQIEAETRHGVFAIEICPLPEVETLLRRLSKKQINGGC